MNNDVSMEAAAKIINIKTDSYHTTVNPERTIQQHISTALVDSDPKPLEIPTIEFAKNLIPQRYKGAWMEKPAEITNINIETDFMLLLMRLTKEFLVNELQKVKDDAREKDKEIETLRKEINNLKNNAKQGRDDYFDGIYKNGMLVFLGHTCDFLFKRYFGGAAYFVSGFNVLLLVKLATSLGFVTNLYFALKSSQEDRSPQLNCTFNIKRDL